jgi:hypothetical protein
VPARRWRLSAVAGICALVLAACSASGISGSAVSSLSPSVEPSPSVKPSPSPNPLVEALVATGPGPGVLAATSESIWVELHRADQVARIDPATNTQVEVLDVPVHCGVAASGDDVWATDHKVSRVTHIPARAGKSVESWDVPGPCGLAVEGDIAWVSSPDDGGVYLLREGAAKPTRRIEVAPMIFDVALDETSAWVTSESDGGTLWRIDRSTYKVTRVGKFAGVDTADVAFGSLWLTSRSLNHLWKVDPADGSLLGELDLLDVGGVVAIGHRLWVTLHGGLVELDPDTLEIQSQVQLGYQYMGPPLYAFGSLWVSALEDDVVVRISVDD